MKKLAVFVEGQTEQLLIERLIREIANTNAIIIENRKLIGGGRSISHWIRLTASASNPRREYYILIIDSSGYQKVKSDIRDNYETLVSSGYNSIIGIRDVFPEVDYTDIPRLRSGLKWGLKTIPIRVAFILGVMEIETWFICEHSHFGRLDSTLTTAYINAKIGFDPSIDDIQLRPIPSNDLDSIYKLVGRRYRKNRYHIMALLNRLDYESLYFEVRHRLPDFSELLTLIDNFLTS